MTPLVALPLFLGCGGPPASAPPAPAPTPDAAPSASERALQGEGYTLPATALLPGAPGHCVVLFAGSGPTDRDWMSTLLPGGRGSARLLAEALQAQGVGSLRFDKVGSGANMQNLQVLTLDHYVDEGRLAFEALAAEAMCQRVTLVGHSEGALHASRTAVSLVGEEKLGGLVLLAGSGKRLLDTAADQVRTQAVAAGFDPEKVEATLTTFVRAVEGLPASAGTSPDLSGIPGLDTLWWTLLQPGSGDVARDLFLADPLAPLAAWRGPTLVVSASHDVQIGAEHADALLAAVPQEAPVRRRSHIAEANHVFRHEDRSLAGTPGVLLMAAYTEAERPLAAGLVDVLVAFLREVEAGSR